MGFNVQLCQSRCLDDVDSCSSETPQQYLEHPSSVVACVREPCSEKAIVCWWAHASRLMGCVESEVSTGNTFIIYMAELGSRSLHCLPYLQVMCAAVHGA